MPSPIVTAYMDIVPTTKGLRGNVARQLGADADKVGRETGRRAGDTAGEEAGRRTGKGIAGGIAKSAGIISAAVAGLAIGDQIMKAVTGAGDLEQSVGAIDTVFKGNADQMHTWADTAAQSVGLSKNAYNEFGTLIGSQLKNAGIPMDDIAGKTNEMITLGADMSSMFGGDTSEAVEALSSALKGERDPIERYGVTLTQASIEAKAMEMGLVSAGGEMDKNAETAATLALITDQTADAQGNFGRESGTLQGQLQRTKASWENMRTEVGMKVLPILTRVVQFGNDKLIPGVAAIGSGIAGAARGVAEFVSGASVEDSGIAGLIGHVKETATQLSSWAVTTGIPAMKSLWEVVGPVLAGAFRGLGDVLGWVVTTVANVGSTLLQFRGTIGSIALVVGAMVGAWKAYRLVMTIVTAVQAAWTAVMVGARAAMAAFRAVVVFGSLAMRAFNLSLLANPIGLVVVAIAGLVTGFVLAYKRIGWFKDGVDALWSGIKSFGSWVGTFFTQTVWPALQGFFSWAGGAFRNLGKIAVSIWRGAGDAISGFLSWITGTLWPGIQSILGGLGEGFRGMGSVVAGAWQGIRDTASGFVGWITGTLWPGIQSVLGWIGAGFRVMGDVAGAVFRGVVSVAQWWWGGVETIFAAARNGLQWVGDKFTWFRNWVNAIFTRVRVFLAVTVAQIRSAAFGALRNGLQWVGDKFTWFRNWVNAIFTRVRDFLADTAGRIRERVFGALRSGLQWAGDKFAWFRESATALFKRLRDALYAAGKAIREQTFDRLKAALSIVGDRFSSVRTRISEIWQNLRTRLYDGFTAIRDKTFGPLKTAVGKVKDAFGSAKDGIVKVWNKLEDATKAPVKFFVNTVYNDGLRAGVNKVLDKVGLSSKHLPTLSLPAGFARGGVLPGYQRRKRDDQLIPMRSGEGVLVPEVVKGIGAGTIHALNAAGNGGGVGAVREVWKDMPGSRPAGKQDAEHQAAGPGTRHFGSLPSFSSATLNKVAQLGELTVEGLGIPSRWGLNDAIKAWDSLNIVDVKAGKIGGGRPAVLAKAANRVPFSAIPNWAGYWKAGAYGGGATDGMWLNSGLRMPTRASSTVTTHEIGHALGLRHAHEGNNARSVMNYNNMYKHNSITSADVGALKSIYPNFVTSKSAKGGVGITTGSGSVLSIVDLLGKAWSALTDKFDGAKKLVTDKFPSNVFGAMGGGVAGMLASGVKDKISSWIQDKIDAGGDLINNLLGRGDMNGRQKGAVSESTVSDWMTEALKKKGLFSDSNLRSGINRARKESNLDPGAINRWDMNWLRGDPSKGLMQVIGSTFNQYKEPGYGDIWKGLDNILASMNYTIAKYGSLRAGWDRPGGYALGGIVPTLFDGGGWLSRDEGQAQIISHRTRQPDAVLSNSQWSNIYSLAMRQQPAEDTGSREYHFHGVGSTEDPEHYARRSSEMLAHTLRKAGTF